MRAWTMLAAVATWITALFGCSDPSAADEANFRKALEPAVRDFYCKTLEVERLQSDASGPPPGFPIVVPAAASVDEGKSARDDRELLLGATKEGYLTASPSTVVAKRVRFTEPPTRQAAASYSPTTKGEAMFRAVDRETASGPVSFPAVCQGRGEIVEIVRWTEPAEMFGRKVTRVTYRFRGTDVPNGMSEQVRSAVEQTREVTRTLALANDGWRLIDGD